MTEATKRKLSVSMRKAYRRKRMSRAMKESWIRRRNAVDATNGRVDLHLLCDAAERLLDDEQLKAMLIERFSTHIILKALTNETSQGFSLQVNLRTQLTNMIKEVLDK
jgi:hypothetical protein